MKSQTMQPEHNQTQYREERKRRSRPTSPALWKAGFFALTMLLTLGTAASSALAATLSVSSILVTQATQNNANTVPLVSARSTAVRANINVSGSIVSIPNLSGRLYVYVNNTLKTPGGIPALNQPFTAKVFTSANNENDTLNFEIPHNIITTAAIANSTTVRFEIDLTHFSHTAVDYASGNFTFSKRGLPRIFYTRINYKGTGLPLVSMVQAGRGNAFVKGIFPIADGNPNLYQIAPSPTMNFNYDPNGDGVIQDYEGSELLDDLEAARQLIVDAGMGADDKVFLYGWLKGNPTDHNGQAVINGRVAYGNTQASRFQRTFAHELMHNFGYYHNNNTLDQRGWDVTARLPGNPAGNNTTGRLKLLTLWDIMRGGQVTNSAWIRADQYTSLFNHDTLKPTNIFPSFANAVAVNMFVHPQDPVGPPVEIRSVFRYPWQSGPSMRFAEEGRFILRARFADGSVMDNPFDATQGEGPEEGEGVRGGPVSLILPYSEQLNSLEILNARTGEGISRLTRSLLLPAVQIVSPRRGETLGNDTVMEFEYRDGDTELGDLKFHVAYSWDDGRSFVPVAVNILPRRDGGPIQFRFDSAVIPPSERKGILRVFVSDGLNTSYDDASELTTPVWVTGKVTLEDCLFPTDQTVTVHIRYNDNDGNPNNDTAQQDVTLTEDGYYTLVGIRPVDCTLQVKAPKWLARTVAAEVGENGRLTADHVALLGGDVNNDNSADVLDLDLMIQAFDTEEGSPNYLIGADINCDTTVDVLDLDILLRNFDQVGDELP